MVQQRRNNNQPQRRPQEVRDFMELNWDDFKKENKMYYGSKSDLKKAFIEETIYLLPYAIDYVVEKGYRKEEEELKEKLFSVIFREQITKELLSCSKDSTFRDDFAQLPYVLSEMIQQMVAKQEELKREGEEPDKDIAEAIDSLLELSHNVLKKKLKKITKKGLDENLAYDLLCILPDKDAINKSTNFKLMKIFQVLYGYGKKNSAEGATEVPIPVDLVIDIFVGEKFLDAILFLLLERKGKYTNFTEGEKKVFNDLTNWVFNTLEEQDGSVINTVIQKYVNMRKRDFTDGKDSPRRYHLESLPESSYPRICKAVKKLIAEQGEDIKKYL